jgi:hypothetical protein
MIKYLLLPVLLFLPKTEFAQGVSLHYGGQNEKIIVAVSEANKILSNPAFYQRIEAILHFDNTTYSGTQVISEFKNLNRVIEVDTYWKWPSKANAKTLTIIKVNTAKLSRTHASITNTIIHELTHAVDWWTNSHFDYTHDGQSPTGQKQTAPWVIGDIAEKLVP